MQSGVSKAPFSTCPLVMGSRFGVTGLMAGVWALFHGIFGRTVVRAARSSGVS